MQVIEYSRCLIPFSDGYCGQQQFKLEKYEKLRNNGTKKKSSPFALKLNSNSSRRTFLQSSSSRCSIIFLDFSVNISQLDNSPEDAEMECLIVIPMEFISESGDHILCNVQNCFSVVGVHSCLLFVKVSLWPYVITFYFTVVENVLFLFLHERVNRFSDKANI